MTVKISGTDGIDVAQLRPADGDPVAITIAADGTVTLTQGQIGVTDGSSASAGEVGEYQSTTTLYSSSVTNSVAGCAATITLQPGDWDVDGMISFSGVSATLTRAAIDISTTISTVSNYAAAIQFSGTLNSAGSGTLNVVAPATRISVAVATPIYLNHLCYFGSGTMSITYAKLSARRVR